MFIVATIIILGLSIIAYSVIENYLPYTAIRPRRVTKEETKLRFPSPVEFGYSVESFSVTTKDTVTLQCQFLSDTKREAKGTIVLVHGIASCKEHMYGVAQWLLPEYDVIVFDQRAHGESTGLNCTYGAYEKYDVQRIIDTVIEKNIIQSSRIAIMGFSLGAAVAMQAMAIDSRIQCGIFEGGFANFRETCHDYAERKFFVRIPWLFDYVLSKTEKIARFAADTVVPEHEVKKIKNPVLFIHGGQDIHIPLKYAERNYRACGSEDKQLKIFKEAAHHDMADKGGEIYQDFVLKFFNEKFHGITPQTNQK